MKPKKPGFAQTNSAILRKNYIPWDPYYKNISARIDGGKINISITNVGLRIDPDEGEFSIDLFGGGDAEEPDKKIDDSYIGWPESKAFYDQRVNKKDK